MSPAAPESHLAYRVTVWFLEHGAQLAPVAIALCVVIVAGCSAVLWFRQGARDLWALEQWRRWWRSRSSRPSGGRGGRSREYQAALDSPHFRRVRAEAIRRAGGRCAVCGTGGRLEAHHALGYARLGRESAGELLPLCHSCHMTAHGRNQP